eukprot:PhM_4_TR9786/c0_g1_i1/m.40477
MNANRAAAAMLSFDELQRCRDVFDRQTDEYVTHPFELKMVLSQLGQYPAEEELHAVMRIHGGKMSFNVFCKYMEYLKYKFISPEPTDMDTIRAFAALGGEMDRTGCVEANYLRDTCKHFDLGIDIDKMLHEVDSDGSGAISFDEFKAMWDHSILEELETSDEYSEDSSSQSSLRRRRASNRRGLDALLFSSDNQKIENALRLFFCPHTVQATAVSTPPDESKNNEKNPVAAVDGAGGGQRTRGARGSRRSSLTGSHNHQQSVNSPMPPDNSAILAPLDALPGVMDVSLLQHQQQQQQPLGVLDKEGLVSAKAASGNRILKGLNDSVRRAGGGGGAGAAHRKSKFGASVRPK